MEKFYKTLIATLLTVIIFFLGRVVASVDELADSMRKLELKSTEFDIRINNLDSRCKKNASEIEFLKKVQWED